MGERTRRRLSIIGASGVVRWGAEREGVSRASGLGEMHACKPPMLVIVALANKIALVAGALIAKDKSYRAPVAAAHAAATGSLSTAQEGHRTGMAQRR